LAASFCPEFSLEKSSVVVDKVAFPSQNQNQNKRPKILNLSYTTFLTLSVTKQ